MKRTLALAFVALLVGTACGSDLVSPAAAVVDGEKITTERIEDALDKFVGTGLYDRLVETQSIGAVKRDFEQGWLSQLIRREILGERAAELDIEVTDDEVEQQIEEIRARFPSEEEFEAALEQQGVVVPLFPELVRDQTLEQKLREEITSDIDPSEAELRGYYEENIDDYRQTRAQHILVGSRALAERLSDQLQSAPKNELDDLFAELAREHSEDQSNAETAGDLGYFTAGEFVQPFVDAAAELEIGEVSAPVQTEFGWHIIRVNDRREEPFEDVREEIAQQVAEPQRETAWQEWVVDAYEEADVRVNPRYGELDLEIQRVRDASAEEIPGAEVPSPDAPAATTPAESPPGG